MQSLTTASWKSKTSHNVVGEPPNFRNHNACNFQLKVHVPSSKFRPRKYPLLISYLISFSASSFANIVLSSVVIFVHYPTPQSINLNVWHIQPQPIMYTTDNRYRPCMRGWPIYKTQISLMVAVYHVFGHRCFERCGYISKFPPREALHYFHYMFPL